MLFSSKTVRQLVAGLLLGLWVGAMLPAHCHELHHSLHSEAQDPGHECLVTLLSKHHLVPGSAPASPCLAVPHTFFAPLGFVSEWVPTPVHALVFSRGPPRSFFPYSPVVSLG